MVNRMDHGLGICGPEGGYWGQIGMEVGDVQQVSILFGHPLALIRGQMWIEPQGKLRENLGWADIGSPNQEITFKDIKFPVRLGNASMPGNSLAGCYMGEDYSTFYTPIRPEQSKMIRQIGPVEARDGLYFQTGFGHSQCVTFLALMNPRGMLQAFSGIFPVKEIDIPMSYIGKALQLLETGFKTGPLLTRLIDGEEKDTLILPRLAERQGTFFWEEQREDGEIRTCRIGPPEAGDRECQEQVSIRDGILKFATGIYEKSS